MDLSVTTQRKTWNCQLGEKPEVNVIAIRATGQSPGSQDQANAWTANGYGFETAANLRLPVLIQQIHVPNLGSCWVNQELLAEVTKALKEAALVPTFIQDFTGKLHAWGHGCDLALGDDPETALHAKSFGLNCERDISRVIIDRSVHPEYSSFRLGLAGAALASHHFNEWIGSLKDLKSFFKPGRLAITDVNLIDATELDSDFVAPALAEATSCIRRSLPNASIASTNISSQDTTGSWEAPFVEAVRNASGDKIIVVVPSRRLWSAQEICFDPDSGLKHKKIAFATCDTYANDPKQINVSYLKFTMGKALGGLCEEMRRIAMRTNGS